jgi:hypothetical protein
MDGAKRKSISAPELYAAIDTAKAPHLGSISPNGRHQITMPSLGPQTR